MRTMMVRIVCWKYFRIQLILLLLPIFFTNRTLRSQIIRQPYQSRPGSLSSNLNIPKQIVLSDKFPLTRQQRSTNKQQLKSKALQTGSSVRQASSSSSLRSVTAAAAFAAAANGLPFSDDEYNCAKYCTCSVIQVIERAKGQSRANLTQAKCDSNLFSDVLTIDRRTQIIHISLPISNSDDNLSGYKSPRDGDPSSSNLAKQQSEQNKIVQKSFQSFRMPRLVQFNMLKEIIIINLRFEVCDSEVFKRGQSLRRFKLNYNQLTRISKACLRHLEKLIELNLDYNNLEELESALFSSLISLKSLSIAHNKLSDLAAHQFVNLTNLVSLNLVGNSFKTINLHLFEPMQNSLRLLLLAKNQIKSFVYSPIQQHQQVQIIPQQQSSNQTIKLAQSWLPQPLPIPVLTAIKSSALLSGVVFKNLIKLNVDNNKLERIKQLQLHRFFTVKYLSIRYNNIATIRDKAFNGLKLIELNLAHNQLVSISKCAFCNATIKRLVLSHNNISLPLPNQMLLEPPTSVLSSSPSLSSATSNQLPRPLASIATNETTLPEPLAQKSDQQANLSPSNVTPPAVSSQNMLILSQSIFGPLFGQLEYLDLSNNGMIANQLDYLLEPLLKLEYLNIAAVGIDRSLPSPTLFKNLRQLKYLNISNNQLDMLVSESVEPLIMLEVLDMSNNRFSELDESFLVTIDELTNLKVINFGSNPWFCSQCKVAPLYDWILRSQIYNYTCIAPMIEMQERNQDDIDNEDLDSSANDEDKQRNNEVEYKSAHDYSILLGDERVDLNLETNIDFDSILSPTSSTDDDLMVNYNYLDSSMLSQSTSLSRTNLKYAASSEDDPSIAQTISSTLFNLNQATNALASRLSFNPNDYCLKCEFPRELNTFKIHELNPGDFKFCADGAPRFAASEPKIGLTLAIVIIGFLFLIIIVVIVMYRRKSNTYYTNEDTDALNGVKKPVLSISSDVEHQYGGDATDYSSPPMSQSYDSYSQEEDEDEEDEEEVEDENEGEEEDEEEDENEEYDEDEGEEEGGGEEDNVEGDLKEGENNEHRKNELEGSEPDEMAGPSLGASSRLEEHHHHHHQGQIDDHNGKQPPQQKYSSRQPSLISGATPNNLRPSSAATTSHERATTSIRDKSQSSVQSNPGSKRSQQIERPSWAPTSTLSSHHQLAEHSIKNGVIQTEKDAFRKSPASRQSSGARGSKLNKLLSNESANSQSTTTTTTSNYRKQQKHRAREVNLAQKFRETQSGSLSLPKRRANKATTLADSVDSETKGRDSWPRARAGAAGFEPVGILTQDIADQGSTKSAFGTRGKRNGGAIYQLDACLKPLSLSGRNSNGSSNGIGEHDMKGGSNTGSSHINSDHKKNGNNKLLMGHHHSHSHRLDSSKPSPYLPAGPSRQHTAGSPSNGHSSSAIRPTMSRQRFAAISNDLPDLPRGDNSFIAASVGDVAMITKQQAEHLVREANAFQQINPADAESSISASLPVPPASDFIQAIGGTEHVVSSKTGKYSDAKANLAMTNQHGMAHQERAIQSPASDATTADSLAMEALEFLANEFEDDIDDISNQLAPISSGAVASGGGEGGALAELDASSLEYNANQMQHLTAPGNEGGRVFRKLHGSNSTHSALTQTGSREMGEYQDDM